MSRALASNGGCHVETDRTWIGAIERICVGVFGERQNVVLRSRRDTDANSRSAYAAEASKIRLLDELSG